MENEELVSVIVPVYNVEKYLEKCLESIINQTYKNLEIICIDDGSPDNSIDILNRFAEKDNRIKVIKQENKGLGATRNVGINLSKGKYISFIDSDDWIDKHMYEKAVNIFKKNSEISLVDCSTSLEKNNGKNKIRNLKNLNYNKNLNGIDYFKLLVKNNLFSASSCNKIFRLKEIKSEKIMFPENRLYEDLLFVFKNLIEAKQVGMIDEVMYHYYVEREESITNLINIKNIEDVLYTYKKVVQKIEKRELLNSIEFKEYMFLWIVRAVLFKLTKVSSQDNEITYNVIKNLKKNKDFQNISKDLFFNIKTKIKYRGFIFLLYFNNKIFIKSLKFFLERKKNEN